MTAHKSLSTKEESLYDSSLGYFVKLLFSILVSYLLKSTNIKESDFSLICVPLELH